MNEEPRYRGRALGDLQVNAIGWPDWCAHHVSTRTERHPDDDDELDIEPEWATEAALEPYRRLSLTAEKDMRATGWTAHATRA